MQHQERHEDEQHYRRLHETHSSVAELDKVSAVVQDRLVWVFVAPEDPRDARGIEKVVEVLGPEVSVGVNQGVAHPVQLEADEQCGGANSKEERSNVARDFRSIPCEEGCGGRVCGVSG